MLASHDALRTPVVSILIRCYYVSFFVCTFDPQFISGMLLLIGCWLVAPFICSYVE